jgi:hypothetical protein
MKIKLIDILGVMLLGMIVVFSSCEEKDDYDYNAIEPVVQGIDGPLTVRGSQIFDYRVYGRGGSTYEFVTTGAIDSFTPIEGEPYGITVDFKESFDDADAKITVTETTMGGKVSEPYTIDIAVTKLRIAITGNNDISVQPEQVVTQEYVPDFLNYPGATYEWIVTGDWASISAGANEAKLVVDYIYPDTPLDSIMIELNVTTRRGNVIKNELKVYVKQFCPLVIEEMVGVWQSTVTLDGENFQMAQPQSMKPMSMAST